MLLWLLCQSWNSGHCYSQLGKSGLQSENLNYSPLTKVYSVLGLLVVGTYNIGLDRQKMYGRQMGGWPTNTNPSFHGVVDTRVINVGSLPQSHEAPVLTYKEDIHVDDYFDDDMDDDLGEELEEDDVSDEDDLKKYEKKRRETI